MTKPPLDLLTSDVAEIQIGILMQDLSQLATLL